MKPLLSRTIPALILALGCILTSSAAGPHEPLLQPDKLVILSTTDVKGKTNPCGCHIPKGGLARRATLADSIRSTFGQVLLVDNGGFFPEDDAHREAAPFLMDEMKTLGTDAVNVGERDLRFGRSYLEQNARRSGIPLVSANLMDNPSMVRNCVRMICFVRLTRRSPSPLGRLRGHLRATSRTASANAFGASCGKLCPMPPVIVRCV